MTRGMQCYTTTATQILIIGKKVVRLRQLDGGEAETSALLLNPLPQKYVALV